MKAIASGTLLFVTTALLGVSGATPAAADVTSTGDGGPGAPGGDGGDVCVNVTVCCIAIASDSVCNGGRGGDGGTGGNGGNAYQ